MLNVEAGAAKPVERTALAVPAVGDGELVVWDFLGRLRDGGSAEGFALTQGLRIVSATIAGAYSRARALAALRRVLTGGKQTPRFRWFCYDVAFSAQFLVEASERVASWPAVDA